MLIGPVFKIKVMKNILANEVYEIWQIMVQEEHKKFFFITLVEYKFLNVLLSTAD